MTVMTCESPTVAIFVRVAMRKHRRDASTAAVNTVTEFAPTVTIMVIVALRNQRRDASSAILIPITGVAVHHDCHGCSQK